MFNDTLINKQHVGGGGLILTIVYYEIEYIKMHHVLFVKSESSVEWVAVKYWNITYYEIEWIKQSTLSKLLPTTET